MAILGVASRRLRRLNEVLVGTFLTLFLPKYGKRMLFVVSLFTFVGGDKAKRHEILCQLNRVMYLAEDERALDFSATISNKVFNQQELRELLVSTLHGRELTTELPLTEVRQLAQKLLERTPRWLRYDNEEKMAYDAERAVLSARKIPGHA
jgi:hypothetical protein